MPKSKTFNTKYGELLKNIRIPEKISDEEYLNSYKPLSEMIEENLPKKLFRYRECNENNIDAFRQNRIYFNTPNNFNDPHDCLVYYNYEWLHKELDSLNITHLNDMIKILRDKKAKIPEYWNVPKEVVKEIRSYPPKLFNEKIAELRKNFNNTKDSMKKEINYRCDEVLHFIKRNSKLACFSQVIKETLMWSYYANSHKGFALEYDFTNFVHKCVNCANQCDKYANYKIFPIVYTNTRYDATTFAYLYTIEEMYRIMGFPPPPNIYPAISDVLAIQKATILRKQKIFTKDA